MRTQSAAPGNSQFYDEECCDNEKVVCGYEAKDDDAPGCCSRWRCRISKSQLNDRQNQSTNAADNDDDDDDDDDNSIGNIVRAFRRSRVCDATHPADHPADTYKCSSSDATQQQHRHRHRSTHDDNARCHDSVGGAACVEDHQMLLVSRTSTSEDVSKRRISPASSAQSGLWAPYFEDRCHQFNDIDDDDETQAQQ